MIATATQAAQHWEINVQWLLTPRPFSTGKCGSPQKRSEKAKTKSECRSVHSGRAALMKLSKTRLGLNMAAAAFAEKKRRWFRLRHAC